MIFIGERVNAGFKDIKNAIQEKDGSASGHPPKGFDGFCRACVQAGDVEGEIRSAGEGTEPREKPATVTPGPHPAAVLFSRVFR